MTNIEAIEKIKNHPRYIEIKEKIIDRAPGSLFKPRYDVNNKYSMAIMRMLLQELKDDGIIDTYLYGAFIRLDK